MRQFCSYSSGKTRPVPLCRGNGKGAPAKSSFIGIERKKDIGKNVSNDCISVV